MIEGLGLGPGDVLEGRYRLDKLLGEGGFGAVFKATQLNLGREVAVKVVLPQLVAMSAGVDRFLREARVAQSLEHPNTVRMYDFGHTDNGVPYIVWELLRGSPLDEVLSTQGALSVERVIRIVTQVLKALMEAHAQGIVHRDIKPANIFLSDFQGEPDFVKVLDFGIAKALDTSDVTGGQALTMAGQIIGTPQYMSPEQVEGEATVGPRADIYALGLVMGELLTGKVVIEGTGLSVCAAHLSPDPVPLAPEVVSCPIGPVIVKATQKPEADRYGSAEEMLNDLRQIADVATTLEPGVQPVYVTAPNPSPDAAPITGNEPTFAADTGDRPGSTPTPASTPAAHAPPSGSAPGATTPAVISDISGPSSQITPKGGKKGISAYVIVGALLVALVVLGGPFIVGLVFLMTTDGRQGDYRPPDTPLDPYSTSGQTEGGGARSGPLATLTPDIIGQRVQAAGYTLVQQPIPNRTPQVSTVVVAGRRHTAMATVMFYNYEVPLAVPAFVAALQTQPGVTRNDDRRVLHVRVYGTPDDRAAAQQLLEAIIQ